MSEIVLTEEQSRLVAKAEGSVVVRNAAGRSIGTLIRQDESDDEPVELKEEIARELIRRMQMKNIQWRTTAEVLASLEALDRR